MSASDPGLRRVSVSAGATVVDLSLPAGVPVATLIPPIVDILEGRDTDGSGGLVGRRYHLCLPGAPALEASTTLAQNGIRDGAVLVLNQARTPPPVLRYDDVAEAVSATLDATARRSNQPQDRPATRLTGAVVASCLTSIGAVTLIRNALSVNVTRHPGATAGVAVEPDNAATPVATAPEAGTEALGPDSCTDAIEPLAELTRPELVSRFSRFKSARISAAL